jgi:branched-chain amino acid transport system substrate-binding protein
MREGETPMGWMTRIMALVSALALALVACTAGDSDAEQIVIGLMTDLSGDLVGFGRDIDEVTTIVVDHVNATGGINGTTLVVEVRDTGGSTESAVIALRDLADSGAVAISGPISSGEAETIFKQAAAIEIPIITGTANKVGITELGDSWAFRNTAPNSDLYAVALPLWADKYNITTAVLVYDEEQVFAKAAATMTLPGIAEDVGIEIVNVDDPITFVRGQNDFTTTVGRIKNTDGDGLIILSGPGEAGLLVRELARRGEMRPVLGHPAQNNQDFFSQGGGEIQDWVLPTVFDPTRDSQLVRDYLEMTGQDGGDRFMVPEAANYYDTVLLLAEVMRAAGIDADTPVEEARTAIRDGLLAIEGFDGVTGTISFAENGDAEKPVYVVVARGSGVERP